MPAAFKPPASCMLSRHEGLFSFLISEIIGLYIDETAVGCSQSKSCFIIMDTKLNTTRVPVQ